MQNKTVEKAAKARPNKTNPTEGQKPSRKTSADIGAITKGSSGRPKGSPRGTDAGRTKAHQTTSVRSPSNGVPKDFLNKLGEMHRSESELALALPAVVAAAKSKDLKTLLRVHTKETKGHVKALDKIARSLEVELPSKSCKEMTRLLKEAVKVVGKRLFTGEKDQEIMSVGRQIEQFEISSYQPLCAQAKDLEFTHEHAVLVSILNQEKLANELLGKLAAGKGPLNQLVEKTSRQKAGARW